MVAFNLYCLCDLGLRELLFGSEDTLFNQTTPSSWPLEMMQGGKLESGVPTDTEILDTQGGGEQRPFFFQEKASSRNSPFLWSGVQQSYTECH